VGIDADVDPEPIEAILIRRLAAPARPRIQPRVDPAAAAPKSVRPEAAEGANAEMPMPAPRGSEPVVRLSGSDAADATAAKPANAADVDPSHWPQRELKSLSGLR